MVNVRNILKAGAVAATLPGAALACGQYESVVAAVQGDDAQTAAALFEEIRVSPDCDDNLREWVGDYLARDSFVSALDMSDPDAKRAALERALGYEIHWRSYAELGRLDWEQKRYAPAAANFQLAINEIDEGDPSHEAENTEIAELVQLASAAMALSDSPVEMPRTRSGAPGGVLKTKIRGFTVEEVSLPITFQYDSTDFDETGATYAAALADHLRSIGADHVTLVGHTDPRGSEDYNLQLSEARAAALGDFLSQQGLSAEIELIGAGESVPPQVPNGIEPGSEEFFRISRRVAFRTE